MSKEYRGIMGSRVAAAEDERAAADALQRAEREAGARSSSKPQRKRSDNVVALPQGLKKPSDAVTVALFVVAGLGVLVALSIFSSSGDSGHATPPAERDYSVEQSQSVAPQSDVSETQSTSAPAEQQPAVEQSQSTGVEPIDCSSPRDDSERAACAQTGTVAAPAPATSRPQSQSSYTAPAPAAPASAAPAAEQQPAEPAPLLPTEDPRQSKPKPDRRAQP